MVGECERANELCHFRKSYRHPLIVIVLGTTYLNEIHSIINISKLVTRILNTSGSVTSLFFWLAQHQLDFYQQISNVSSPVKVSVQAILDALKRQLESRSDKLNGILMISAPICGLRIITFKVALMRPISPNQRALY
jgi:hypothetical protein